MWRRNKLQDAQAEKLTRWDAHKVTNDKMTRWQDENMTRYKDTKMNIWWEVSKKCQKLPKEAESCGKLPKR